MHTAPQQGVPLAPQTVPPSIKLAPSVPFTSVTVTAPSVPVTSVTVTAPSVPVTAPSMGSGPPSTRVGSTHVPLVQMYIGMHIVPLQQGVFCNPQFVVGTSGGAALSLATVPSETTTPWSGPS
jgi:hypothetical protein